MRKSVHPQGTRKQGQLYEFLRRAWGRIHLESDRLKGKFQSCLVKSRKESSQTINLVVACASGVMLSNVQFFLKVIDDNSISREFPGMEGMDVKYYRCQI